MTEEGREGTLHPARVSIHSGVGGGGGLYTNSVATIVTFWF